MLYIAARNLQVGDVFYADNVLDNRAPYRVVGVGKATQTYGWRKTKTREVVKVMAEELVGSVTLDPTGFTFGPGDGMWIDNRKDTA